jgi:hypothetical protein
MGWDSGKHLYTIIPVLDVSFAHAVKYIVTVPYSSMVVPDRSMAQADKLALFQI